MHEGYIPSKTRLMGRETIKMLDQNVKRFVQKYLFVQISEDLKYFTKNQVHPHFKME